MQKVPFGVYAGSYIAAAEKPAPHVDHCSGSVGRGILRQELTIVPKYQDGGIARKDKDRND